MTRPDSGSPDQSANQDDAVWLDLVARLEADSAAGINSADTPGAAGIADPANPTNPAGTANPANPTSPANTADPAGTPDGKAASFRDFDPLGLAGAAPTEPSAAERLAASSPPRPAEGSPASQGPRDYDVEDEDGFIPEEPPSLAGTDPLTMLAWLAAVGGPVALLLSAMFWRSAPLLAVLGIVAVFVLAVVYLIMKLPQEKDENDDGARV
ncbi:hypothetical protein QFZ30_002540 [Arthrobacter pascens]|uniref:hypothetical protein n=1 Tax=Arthrobacter pascens TaxID=1677 RepID=UPI00278E3EC5|nr:hypothetical protein [Arthrobacter pascens]MDQ0679158.1 hypothetical protein [Arthrobacter pascens]